MDGCFSGTGAAAGAAAFCASVESGADGTKPKSRSGTLRRKADAETNAELVLRNSELQSAEQGKIKHGQPE